MKKEESQMRQALREAAMELALEDMKMDAIEQVAGLHVFSADMNKSPIVIVDGKLTDVLTLLAYFLRSFIDDAVENGVQRAKIERVIVRVTQQAIAQSRMKAYEKNTGEGEKDSGNDNGCI